MYDKIHYKKKKKAEKKKKKRRWTLYVMEFKVMAINMLTKLRREMDEHSENLNKNIENIFFNIKKKL